jgi:hypothetical protein
VDVAFYNFLDFGISQLLLVQATGALADVANGTGLVKTAEVTDGVTIVNEENEIFFHWKGADAENCCLHVSGVSCRWRYSILRQQFKYS